MTATIGLARRAASASLGRAFRARAARPAAGTPPWPATRPLRLAASVRAPLALDLLLLAPLLLGPLAPPERATTLLLALVPLALLHEAATRLGRAPGRPDPAWLLLGLLGFATLVALAPALLLPALLAAAAAFLRAGPATGLAAGFCSALGAALRVDAGLTLLALEHGPIAPLFAGSLVLLGSLASGRAATPPARGSRGLGSDVLHLAALSSAAALWPALLAGLGLLGAEPRPWAVLGVLLLLGALPLLPTPAAEAEGARCGSRAARWPIPRAATLWAAWLVTVAWGGWAEATFAPDFVP